MTIKFLYYFYLTLKNAFMFLNKKFFIINLNLFIFNFLIPIILYITKFFLKFGLNHLPINIFFFK